MDIIEDLKKIKEKLMMEIDDLSDIRFKKYNEAKKNGKLDSFDFDTHDHEINHIRMVKAIRIYIKEVKE